MYLNTRNSPGYPCNEASAKNGFTKWSLAHPPGNDDDQPGGATPIALVDPVRQPGEAALPTRSGATGTG